MSTKTLLKRLALGTVVALSASVLTVTSAHAASATGGDFSAVSGTGVLSSSNINADLTTAATVNLLSTGSLTVAGSVGALGGYYVVSAGGAITAATASNAGTSPSVTISADQTNVTCGGTGIVPTSACTFTVKPTGVAGSVFTITGYTSSSGTLTSVMTVTINGASTYGVPSVAKSYLSWRTSNTAGNTPLTADVASGNSATTGQSLYLQIDLKDAYGNPVTTAGALTATVSPGAYVSLVGGSTTPTAVSPAWSTAVYGAAPTDATPTYGVEAQIQEATAGAGWNGTITVSYNGTVIGTKSGTITGVVSKISVTPGVVVHTNTETFGAFSYHAYDTAGNEVVGNNGTLAVNTNSNTAAVTAVTGKLSNTAAGVAGNGSITGGTTAGTSSVTLKYVNTLGATVVSNAFTVTTGGAAASYKASFDKASYGSGDIATLKITFLDSKGNPAASDSALYTVSGSAAPYLWNASFATPELTLIGTTGQFATTTATLVSTYPASQANLVASGQSVVYPDATGTITLKYTVGSTEGAFNAIVDFPTLDGASSAASAQTVAYKVANAGSTSLNDVLKGIVSLIASINKQIAALAKLVTKK